MSDGLRLDIDNRAMREMIAAVGATPKQAQAAVKRALRRLQKHIMTGSAKVVAKRIGAPLHKVRKRYHSSAVDEDGVEIWAGTWALDAMSFGKARQTKAGVKVGRLPLFRGAFIGRPWRSRGDVGVFIRRSSRHYNPSLYPSHPRTGSRFGSSGADRGGRYPVVRVRVPIEDAVIGSFRGNAPEYEQFFLRQLEAELNYQINVKGKQ